MLTADGVGRGVVMVPNTSLSCCTNHCGGAVDVDVFNSRPIEFEFGDSVAQPFTQMMFSPCLDL